MKCRLCERDIVPVDGEKAGRYYHRSDVQAVGDMIIPKSGADPVEACPYQSIEHPYDDCLAGEEPF